MTSIAAVQQGAFMPPPSERNNSSVRRLSCRQLPEAEERGGNRDSPQAGAVPDLQISAAELTHDHLQVPYNGDELDEAMQVTYVYMPLELAVHFLCF